MNQRMGMLTCRMVMTQMDLKGHIISNPTVVAFVAVEDLKYEMDEVAAGPTGNIKAYAEVIRNLQHQSRRLALA